MKLTFGIFAAAALALSSCDAPKVTARNYLQPPKKTACQPEGVVRISLLDEWLCPYKKLPLRPGIDATHIKRAYIIA